MREEYHKQVLYDPEWQRIRLECLGHWAYRDGVEMNLGDLHIYARKALTPRVEETPEYRRRVWRILNLLNAVLLGTHCGDRQAVTEARDRYTQIHDRLPLIHEPWDWSVVQVGLQALSPSYLKSLRDNLKRRVATAKRRGHNPETTRPELMHFMSLLALEVSRRANG